MPYMRRGFPRRFVRFMKPGGRVTVHELEFCLNKVHKRREPHGFGLYACLRMKFAYGNPEVKLRVFILGEHDTPG